MSQVKQKKIGLAINYNYPDYGGMLQAFATYRKLGMLGYQSEAINIDALSRSIRKRKWKYFAKNIFDSSIVFEKSQIIKKKLRIKLSKNFKYKMMLRNNAFDDFYKSHFCISQPYKNWNELSKACYNYSAILVGSDQLWLPSNIEADYYTLSFVPDEIKKIAYATSFGVSNIPRQQEKKAREFLKRINYLSARETSGQNIIKKYTGRDVPQVCDPALLLTADQWSVITKNIKLIEGEYIFCYFMGNNPYHRTFVKNLKKQTGHKIVALLHLDQFIADDENYADEAPYNISPADFVSLIKNARYVCTDSFHGTVFSIIFKRDFFVFRRFAQNATLSTNTRIDSLLQRMDLKERLIEEKDSIDKILKKKIDFNKVHQILDQFRIDSEAYLINAIDS